MSKPFSCTVGVFRTGLSDDVTARLSYDRAATTKAEQGLYTAMLNQS